jgi:hypothetical protein
LRPGERLHQQAAEHEAQTPVQHRGKDRDECDEPDGAATHLRNGGEFLDQPRRGRRAGDDVAADGDEGHLHRERNEAPEAEAELLGDLHRSRAIDHRAGRDDDQRHRDEDEGIGNHFSAQAVNPSARRAM